MSRYLAAQRLVHYLPLIDRVNIVRGRKFVSQVPLFPGYVFLKGEPNDAYGAVSNKRVCRILPVPDQQRFITEMAQIERAIASNQPLDPYPFAVVGRRCRVTKGPLMGMEGFVTKRERRNRLVLHVDVLGRGAALEIDLDLLEPVD